jgi:hypothetical protein
MDSPLIETNNSLSPAEEGYENLVTLQGIAMGDNKLVRTVLNTTSAKGHFTDSKRLGRFDLTWLS